MLKNILEIWEIISQKASKTKVKLRILKERNREICGSSTKTLTYISSYEENKNENFRDMVILRKSYEKLMNKFVNPRLDILTPSINTFDKFKDTQQVNIKTTLNTRRINIMSDGTKNQVVPTLPSSVYGIAQTELGWSGQPLNYQSVTPRPELSIRPNDIASAFFIFPELIVESKKEAVLQKSCSPIINKRGKKRHGKHRTSSCPKSRQLIQDIPKSHLSKFYKVIPPIFEVSNDIEHTKKYNFIAPPNSNMVEKKGKEQINADAIIVTEKYNYLGPRINSDVSLSKETSKESSHAHFHKEGTDIFTSNELLSGKKSDHKSSVLSRIKVEPGNISCSTPQFNENRDGKLFQNIPSVPIGYLPCTHTNNSIHNATESSNKINNTSNLSLSNNFKTTPSLEDSITQPDNLNTFQPRNTCLKGKPIIQSGLLNDITFQEQQSDCINSENKCLPHSNIVTPSPIQNQSITKEITQKEDDKSKQLNPQRLSLTANISKCGNENHSKKKSKCNVECNSINYIQHKKLNFDLGKIVNDNTKPNTKDSIINSSIIQNKICLDQLHTSKQSLTKHTLNNSKIVSHAKPNILKNKIGTQIISQESTEQTNNNTNILKPIRNCTSHKNKLNVVDKQQGCENNHNNLNVQAFKLSSNIQLKSKLIQPSEDSLSKTTIFDNDSKTNDRNKGRKTINQLSIVSARPKLDSSYSLDVVQQKSPMSETRRIKKSVINNKTFQNNYLKFVKNKEWYFNPYLNKLSQQSTSNTLTQTHNKNETVDMHSGCQDTTQHNDIDNNLYSKNQNNKSPLTGSQAQLKKLEYNSSPWTYSEDLLENRNLRNKAELKSIPAKKRAMEQFQKHTTCMVLKNNEVSNKSLPINCEINHDNKINESAINRNKWYNTDNGIFNEKRKLHRKKVNLKVFNLKMYGSEKRKTGGALSNTIQNVSKSLNIKQYKKIDYIQARHFSTENYCSQTNKCRAITTINALLRTRTQQYRNLSVIHKGNRTFNYIYRRYATTMANYNTKNSKSSWEYPGSNKSHKVGSRDEMNYKVLGEYIKGNELKAIKCRLINNQNNKCKKINNNDIAISGSNMQIQNSSKAKVKGNFSNIKLGETDNVSKIHSGRWTHPSKLSYCLNTRENNLLTNNNNNDSPMKGNEANTSQMYAHSLNKWQIINSSKNHINHEVDHSDLESMKNVESLSTPSHAFNQDRKAILPEKTDNLINTFKVSREGRIAPSKITKEDTIKKIDTNLKIYKDKQMDPSILIENMPKQEKWKSKRDRLKNWTLVKNMYEQTSHKSTLFKTNSRQRIADVSTSPITNTNYPNDEPMHMINGSTNTVPQIKVNKYQHQPTVNSQPNETNVLKIDRENQINEKLCILQQNKHSLNVKSSLHNFTESKINSDNESRMPCNHENQTSNLNNYMQPLENKNHEIIKKENIDKKELSRTFKEVKLLNNKETSNIKNTHEVNSIFNSLIQKKNVENKSNNKKVVNSTKKLCETNVNSPINHLEDMPNVNNPGFLTLKSQCKLENTFNKYQLHNTNIDKTANEAERQTYLKSNNTQSNEIDNNSNKTIIENQLTTNQDLTVSAMKNLTSAECDMLNTTLNKISNQQINTNNKKEKTTVEKNPKNHLNKNDEINSLQASVSTNKEELTKSLKYPHEPQVTGTLKSCDTTINYKPNNNLKIDSNYQSFNSVKGSYKNNSLNIAEIKRIKKSNSKIKIKNMHTMKLNQNDNGFSTRMINNVPSQSNKMINKVVPLCNQDKYNKGFVARGITLGNSYRNNSVKDLFSFENNDVIKTKHVDKNKTPKIQQSEPFAAQNIKTTKGTCATKGNNKGPHSENPFQHSSGGINCSRSLNEGILKTIMITNASQGNLQQNVKTQKEIRCLNKNKGKTIDFKDDIANNRIFLSQLPTREVKQSDHKLKHMTVTENIAIKEKKSVKGSKIDKIDNINPNIIKDRTPTVIHPIEKEEHTIKIPLKNPLKFPCKKPKFIKTALH